MFKKYIFAAAALFMVSSAALADTNKMIVNKTDGSSVTFDVSDITAGTVSSGELKLDGQKVADLSEVADIRFIDHSTLPFTITNPKGEITGAYESVPSMLRVVGAAAGDPSQFAYGTVEANAASELSMGDYGIYLSLAPTAMKDGGIKHLSADQGSYILKLYTYSDGQAVDSLTSVSAGAIEYSWNATRKRLVLNVNATFSDGTVLKSEFTGAPVDVASVAEIVPAKTYGNEFVIVDAAGTSSRSIALTGVSKKTRTATASNPRTLTFTFDVDDWNYDGSTLEIIPEDIIDKGDIDMATVTGNCYYLRASSFQFYTVDAGRQSPLDGVMNIKDLGDGNYEIFLQVTNYYNNPFGSGQTGSRENLTIHWKGQVK